MSEILDLLLRSDAPDVRRKLPEKKFEVTRLSEVAGVPVVFNSGLFLTVQSGISGRCRRRIRRHKSPSKAVWIRLSRHRS